MFARISYKLADQLIENGTIDAQKKEIYTYGIEQTIIIFMNIVTSLIIGIFLGMLWQSIIFMIVYLPLRSNAGGYHASTVLRCYLVGIILTVSDLLIIKYIPSTVFIVFILTIIASLIILILAPVETSNKPLDHTEFTVYKKRTRQMLVTYNCIILLLLTFDLQGIALSVAVALIVLSSILVLGKIIK